MERRCNAAVIVLVRGDDVLATWPLVTRVPPDLDVADDLARLQLLARRMDCAIRLRDASADLVGLLELVGLREVIGQAEEAEEARVEEVVHGDDPVA